MDAQWVGIWINVVVALAGFIGAVISITSVVSNRFSSLDKKLSESIATTKGEFNARFEMFEKTQEDKISKVWTRFDEHKRICDDKFVGKDLCNVMHNTTALALNEVKDEIKSIHVKLDRIFEGRKAS